MATTSEPTAPIPATIQPVWLTVADLQEHLGGIPAERIRLVPAPGSATEQDCQATDKIGVQPCELIDGVLVEKTVGAIESVIALFLAVEIRNYLRTHDLGRVLGADGTVRLLPGQLRAPDVAFYSWAKLPGNKIPQDAFPSVVPDLAVEVLSRSNTKREMRRKLEEYFTAGTALVWFVDPASLTARVFYSVDESKELSRNDVLDGESVLPGLQIKLTDVFAEAGL